MIFQIKSATVKGSFTMLLAFEGGSPSRTSLGCGPNRNTSYPTDGTDLREPGIGEMSSLFCAEQASLQWGYVLFWALCCALVIVAIVTYAEDFVDAPKLAKLKTH